ncbi:hypothetical protein [Methylopila sp. M107]|uniref:hypothetical protein n=1 Tax=Methylopila sp. M107 TaxID=1101190 RepID=UPI00035CD7B6|nr:hypothetical protein [Methylopila sp. M107]
MTTSILIRTTAIVLVASFTAACGAPYGAKHYDPVPGTNGRWIYDGKVPLSCNRNDIRVRHFEGDGHPSDAAEHAHVGHGHKWSKRNFKGYPTKPPCYVRRASAQFVTPSDLATAATRSALFGDL